MSEWDSDIQEAVKKFRPGSVVVNYVLLAEIVTDDGQELLQLQTEEMTSWMRLGMLHTAVSADEPDDDEW